MQVTDTRNQECTRHASTGIFIVFIALLENAYTASLPISVILNPEEETKSDYLMKRSAPQPAPQLGWVSKAYNGPLAMIEVQRDGTLVETSEVMAARAAHLAALEAARASNPDMDDGQYDPHKYGDHHYGVDSHVGDLAKGVLFYDSLAKSHQSKETSMNKVGHSQGKSSSAAVAKVGQAVWKTNTAASATYGPSLDQNKTYPGPLAMIELLDTGFLADTPDVATAKKIHFRALAEATAAADLWKAKSTQHQPWNRVISHH
ncbi:hypothetical protein J6590_000922 [Homalodisca vitripennis]|nr:hypothetical protein J6590_000922 [Homalodisca vitripennis]